MSNMSPDLARELHSSRMVEVEALRQARRAAALQRLQRRAVRLSHKAERISRRAERAASQAQLAVPRVM